MAEKVVPPPLLLPVTVTVQVAVKPPSTVVTVITATPAEMAVTAPLVTLATLLLLEVQSTVLLAALVGRTVAVKTFDCPTFREILLSLSTTPVTGSVNELMTSWAPQAAIENTITAARVIIPTMCTKGTLRLFFIKTPSLSKIFIDSVKLYHNLYGKGR